jgi:RimJ/RimL family protein N-acetyltransferase
MELKLRFATIRDIDIYYEWTNDPIVRKNSYHQTEIIYQQHVSWFKNRLHDKNCYLYFFSEAGIPIGQVRIDIGVEDTVIGVSVDQKFRGRSLSAKMLIMATDDFLDTNPNQKIHAYIKEKNLASYKAFLKAGFKEAEKITIHGVESFKLIK